MPTPMEPEASDDPPLGAADTVDVGGGPTGRRDDELPAVDAVPEGVIDPALRKLVLSRMFERHREAPLSIGRLRVLDRLGAGGMGVVYAAYDEQLDRKVAVKVLRSGRDQAEDIGRSRLLREAQAMARLTHPNVATVYEVGSVAGGIYLSMEFIRGRSLDRWLREGDPRGWREVVGVFLQAGRGLAAAHRAGIVHRDFKPHNVMLGQDGAVKVLDFGLAHTSETTERDEDARTFRSETSSVDLGSRQEVLTRTGAILGTPAYMAPEQYGALPTTEKSDQFSFCVALYEGLYGRLPFPAESLATLAAAVLDGRLLPIPTGSSVPPWVRRVVLRGLAREADERHPSMDALLDALARDPAAIRRRLAATLVAVVVVGAGGFTLARALAPASAMPSCDDARAELAATWTPERRSAVETALAAAGSHGAEAWARVGPALDGYAEDWIAMRDEACQTHLEARQSDTLFDRRVACLDQNRAGFDALTELLAAADADVVERAATAVAGLPPIARCGDTAALTSAVEVPADPQAAALVQEQRQQLARAKEHEDLGQFPAGLELADAAIEAARELEYRPLEAEALLRRGSLLMEGGTPQDAEATLSKAFLEAVAADHPEVAVEALSKRMFMRGEWMREVARALEDRGLGEAMFEQVPHARRQYGVYLNNLGLLLHRAGEYGEATTTFERALEVKREAFGPRHPEIALTLANVGLFRFGLKDSVAARAHLEEAIDIAEEALGAGHPLTTSLSVTLAEVLIELRRRTDARVRLERARALQEPELASRGPRVRETFLNLGRLELDERRYEQGRIHLQRALEIARASGSTYLTIEPLHGLGFALIGAGEVEEGLRRLEEAHGQATATMAADDHALLGSRILLARGYAQAGRAQEALAHLEAALEHYEKGSAQGDVAATNVLAPLARLMMQSGDAKQAESLATRGLLLLEGAGVHDGPQVAKLLGLRGEARLARASHGDAVMDLRQAQQLLASTCDPDAFELAMSRFALARALRSASPPAAVEAEDLAQLALAVLSAKGTPFEDEARQVEAWLAQ